MQQNEKARRKIVTFGEILMQLSPPEKRRLQQSTIWISFLAEQRWMLQQVVLFWGGSEAPYE